jgi:hypothetical protein
MLAASPNPSLSCAHVEIPSIDASGQSGENDVIDSSDWIRETLVNRMNPFLVVEEQLMHQIQTSNYCFYMAQVVVVDMDFDCMAGSL